ncbi:hypothetical protein [Winogradskyella sp. SYSU M77433]|uniref:hypothetical protein n=1 Tax=Winogradskyella sp. SYSU M77433 TaxID=3042722 RepID=UPI0024812ED1|nr:hypothetical protein [Winogradskyella sp. SYSU M77433]MDH7913215.1 hypothetical protein [Winogradskyella sp. SYSU M77433]
MNEKEAKEIIENFVLENFDDRWHTKPLFFREYYDFFKFYINSKEYVETGEFGKNFVGLGSAYISKKFKEIVQYGSGHYRTTEDFLKTEHKLSLIRTKYNIDRADYRYNVSIQNIIDEEKASKYIDGILIYSGGLTFKEMKSQRNYELSSINYFGLLNLLYFNIINPFCEIFYEKRIIIGHDDINELRQFSSINGHDSEDILFQEYMLEKVNSVHPKIRLDKCYSVDIKEIYKDELFSQYSTIAGFSYYGYDEQTGFEGFLWYRENEIEKRIKQKKMSFEFVKGIDILFFLFINSITPFCRLELNLLNIKNVQ